MRGFFEGEATSEVGPADAGGGDLWTAMRPDLSSFDGFIGGADRRISAATEGAEGGNAPFLERCGRTCRGWR